MQLWDNVIVYYRKNQMTEINLSNFVYKKVQVTFQNGKKYKGEFEYCHLLSSASFPYVFWGDNRKGDHYNRNGVNAFAEAFGNSHNIIQIEEIKSMTEQERIEGEIKILQSKLELLKEIENHKSPVEKAYKEWWGEYPSTEKSVSETEDMRWLGFQAGYEAAQLKDVGVPECPDEPDWYDVEKL